MRTKLIRITWFVLILFVGVLVLNGCNTWKGAGKDIERTGENMQGDEE